MEKYSSWNKKKKVNSFAKGQDGKLNMPSLVVNHYYLIFLIPCPLMMV